MHAKPLFIEIPVAAPVEALWTKTQDPAQHVRWDMRFTGIEYLPRPDSREPQRFRYETRLGLGLAIAGCGETVGSGAGGASALRFWSDERLSLIRVGTGSWVYKPIDNPRGPCTLFRTVYQYEVRFGRTGQWFDRLLFRPLMGWATAWSFDRLRLWLEREVAPERSARIALLHGGARLILGMAWIWHGLASLMLPAGHTLTAMRFVGAAEMAVGLAVAVAGRSHWVLGASALLLLRLMPNPALFALVAVAWMTEPYAPNAARCRRRSQEG